MFTIFVCNTGSRWWIELRTSPLNNSTSLLVAIPCNDESSAKAMAEAIDMHSPAATKTWTEPTT